MKILKVNQLVPGYSGAGPEKVSEELDKQAGRNFIDTINWESHSYRPLVEFALAYYKSGLLLKYYVREESFRAVITENNGNVYEDSCVEFFVAPYDDGLYYNFEFNGIGTCLVGIGSGREGRERLATDITDKIIRSSSAGTKPVEVIEGLTAWTITIIIPFDVFVRHRIADPAGMKMRANFYKCGDKMRTPHYLTWNPVISPRPDFHRPEHFGLLEFI
jgi:hypothetical protein